MSEEKKFSGYATFSEFISTDPELSIYRTFPALSCRSLLYQQSEILKLERKLKDLDEQDYQDANLDVLLSAKCWETFAARASDNEQREAERMQVIRTIEKKIKIYHESLLLQSQVLKLPKPSSRVFGVFRTWFESERPFVGYGSELLSSSSRPDDFVTLERSVDHDFLTDRLQELGGRLLPGKRHETASEIKYYSAKHVSRLVTIITVLVASLVINGSIVALYLVKDEHTRLGMIIVFTSLFATSLAILTDGRRTDIILATAACAAVLVVFVSTSENG